MKRIISIILAFSLTSLVFATSDGESRSTTVTMEVGETDLINIEAKYTALIVESWNKNEVEIEASVRYDGKITNKIQEFLDDFENRVNKNITLSGGELRVDTNLDLPNKVQIGSKYVGINISYGDELKVTYRIKSPGKNKHVISTSYEDARLIGGFSTMDFTQYSGELTAESIESAKMNLKYGSAEIEKLGTAELELYEQEMNVKEIDQLTLNAKYSDLEYGKVGSIETEAYETDFEIEILSKLKGNLKYGDITISQTLGQAELILYEVEFEAEKVDLLEVTNSKYSKFVAEVVSDVLMEQSYEDETEFGEIQSFVSKNSKYGNHTIGLLTRRFELNAYEDEVEFEKVSGEVEIIKLEGKYIDASIELSNTAFKLDSDTKYGDISYNEDSMNVTRYIKDGDRLQIEAQSKDSAQNPISIWIRGYEIEVSIN